MEFYKNKLKEKVDLIFKNKGLENNLVLKDSLFIGIKPGKYEIVWDIKQENGNRREGDVVKIYSNSFKARKLLNWKAEKTIDDIVKSAWNWHKNKI